MSLNSLPDESHVVRYASPRFVDDGIVEGGAFIRRSHEPTISLNWLEAFGGLSKDQQLHRIRQLTRIEMRENGRLAELNVGQTRAHMGSQLEGFDFITSPLAATPDHPADPSHAEIVGLPSLGSPEAELLGDMIAECVLAGHPTVT